MHIAKVNYQKTFNLGNYQSEKIGIEMELNQGESASKALDVCKELVEEYHRENLKTHAIVDVDTLTIEVIQTQSKQSVVEKAIMFINSCTSEEDMKAWEFMSKTYPNVKEAYDKKLKTIK
jgi:hypothetical protein